MSAYQYHTKIAEGEHEGCYVLNPVFMSVRGVRNDLLVAIEEESKDIIKAGECLVFIDPKADLSTQKKLRDVLLQIAQEQGRPDDFDVITRFHRKTNVHSVPTNAK